MACEVLLLTRRPLSMFPVWEWIPEANVRVIASAEYGTEAVAGPDAVDFVDGYAYSANVDLAVLRASRHRPIDHLIVFAEHDVARAAALREYLHLPGQRWASAESYRDKAVMKAAWQRAGLPIPAFSAVEAPADLFTFARQHGYPVVVKPRRASGSVGVAVLTDEDDTAAWLAKNWRVPLGASFPWMAESFVAGRMLQVDGIWTGLRAEINWPTSVDTLLGWMWGDSCVSMCLEADDPLVPPVQDLVTTALRALPGTDGPIVYHAEVWVRDDGHLAMNEVAARIGGGQTREIVCTAFGVDLIERFVRGTVDAEVFTDPAPIRPQLQVGVLEVPPRAGEVIAIDDVPRELANAPWLRSLTIAVKQGRRYRGPENSSDFAAACLAVGASPAEVGARLAEFAAWAEASIHYKPPAPSAESRAR
jgi:Carbamoyl-phosphate synthase L chain, ATP binding domain